MSSAYSKSRGVEPTLPPLSTYNQVQKSLEVFAPASPLKQCCNYDSLPPGLLKWSASL